MAVLETILESLGGKMPELPVSNLVSVIIALVIAALMCFMGYRLLRVFVAVGGLALGAVLGILLGGKISESPVVMMILAIVFAVGLCLISFLVYKAGVFIFAFGTVFAVLSVILQGMTLPLDYRLIALIAAAVIGIITVIAVRPLTIIVTGLGGGMAIATTLGDLVSGKMALPPVVMIVIGVVLGVCGMLVQFRTTKEKGTKR